jgi:hypothetical protein
MLAIILLHKRYFLKKYFTLKIYWDNVFFYFLKLIFISSHQNKTKTSKILIWSKW